MSSQVSRWPTKNDELERRPVHVVWEVTLACNLSCLHCGSRAGSRRVSELSTSDALSLVDELFEQGVQEITLIGGEVFLRKDIVNIVEKIKSRSIYCSVQTGGYLFPPKIFKRLVESGLDGLGVSIDGLAEDHDRMRQRSGSYASALKSLELARQMSVPTSVNTQVNSVNAGYLPMLIEEIASAGVSHWQPQLTVAMGNAVDNDEIISQPKDIPFLAERIFEAYKSARKLGMTVTVGNNIGYFGPYERYWRGFANKDMHWSGCRAEDTVMGIEADGRIKGCPSLESSTFSMGHWSTGNLGEIWQSGRIKNKTKVSRDEKNFCGVCNYRQVCNAGCTWTGHSLTGERGNNPFCHYRALRFASVGIGEEIVKVREADNNSFGTGEFQIKHVLIDENSPAIGQISDKVYSLLRDECKKKECSKNCEMYICNRCNYHNTIDIDKCHNCGLDKEESFQRSDAENQRMLALADIIKSAIESRKSGMEMESINLSTKIDNYLADWRNIPLD